MEKDIKAFMKTYADCLLYRKYPQYNAILLSAILKGERIDKTDKAFEDVVYDIKRSKTDKTIMQVLMSDNTILLFPFATGIEQILQNILTAPTPV